MELMIEVCDNPYKYDFLLLKPEEITRDFQKIRENKSRKKLKRLDSYLLHYMVKEFNLSQIYRTSFLKTFYEIVHGKSGFLKFVLLPTQKDLIDYNWNERVDYMIRERCELDHALSWLSTLGGAFSALGDYFSGCALIAGKISVHQLQLALRLNDPNVVTRCRLYFSLSLIQRKYFKLARKIIQEEYVKAKNDVVVDERLVRMCKGIWAKLQYEYGLFKRKKKTKRLRDM